MCKNIEHLTRDTWEGHALCPPEEKEEFQLSFAKEKSGYLIRLFKVIKNKEAEQTPPRKRSSGHLYAASSDQAFAWGIRKEGDLCASVETCPDRASENLIITQFWLADGSLRGQEGQTLLDVAKEQARLERRPGIKVSIKTSEALKAEELERAGFILIGLERATSAKRADNGSEDQLTFDWRRPVSSKLKREAIEIRPEQQKDWHEVERVTQKAFWNKYRPGCDEHYLVSRLRKHADYLPDLSRIALVNGRVVGGIFYSRARVIGEDQTYEVLTFGPLFVDPDMQGCGIGECLLKETMTEAKNQGYRGIIIYGEPDYYLRIGFHSCADFGITTAEGNNFEAFMGIELVPGGPSEVQGKYYHS
ncbi:Acetyltransferase [Alkalibacterium sp. AK22]|uniref:GNAT family N-acetyltransferase n=1 Tax=Alkalibacterium sp. AK22 TaxID=1229520 RepID=UPI00044EB4C5|nr:N-acetyltransferase [Alkalibacterium sp. AK22]EXJ23126.1 Acetyltransferase [Alkalibacterium sp. AK22]